MEHYSQADFSTVRNRRAYPASTHTGIVSLFKFPSCHQGAGFMVRKQTLRANSGQSVPRRRKHLLCVYIHTHRYLSLFAAAAAAAASAAAAAAGALKRKSHLAIKSQLHADVQQKLQQLMTAGGWVQRLLFLLG
jgi:hypothetical protein